MFRNKKVLVAGGTGLIGIPLVQRLIEAGARVRVASLDDPSRAHPEAEFIRIDLITLENCLSVCRGMDYVFNLLCAKGSPDAMRRRPADFFLSNLLLDIHLMEAARRSGVGGFLLASSVAVYGPAEVFHEEDVWKTFPSSHDRFAGWAKRMGELQAEAYRIQEGWKRISIVRPSNVYGPYDNFELENAMVIPSLVKRAVDGENPLVIWGDGSAERDFIHAGDVARGMMLVAEKAPAEPVNLGSGVGVPIRRLVEIILSQLKERPEVVWDASKPAGDRKRIVDISRARALGFRPQIPLEKGIPEAMAWYKANRRKSQIKMVYSA